MQRGKPERLGNVVMTEKLSTNKCCSELDQQRCWVLSVSRTHEKKEERGRRRGEEKKKEEEEKRKRRKENTKSIFE